MSFEFLTKTGRKQGRWDITEGMFCSGSTFVPKACVHLCVCVCMRVCVCVCVWCLLCIQNTGEQTVAVDGGAGAEEEAEQGCEMENPEGKYWP